LQVPNDSRVVARNRGGVVTVQSISNHLVRLGPACLTPGDSRVAGDRAAPRDRAQGGAGAVGEGEEDVTVLRAGSSSS